MHQDSRTSPSRATRPVLGAAPLIGAVLGALVLGPGGRLAMRAVTLWEHRPHLFSVSGTLSVVAWGAAFGGAAGLLRLGVEAAFGRSAPLASPGARAASFATACLAAALLVLTPWT